MAEQDVLRKIRALHEQTLSAYRERLVELRSETERIETIIAAIRGELGISSGPQDNYTVIHDIKALLIQFGDDPVLETDIIKKLESIAKAKRVPDPKGSIHRSLEFHTRLKKRDLVCVEWRDGKLKEVPFKKGSSRRPEENLIMLRSKFASLRN